MSIGGWTDKDMWCVYIVEYYLASNKEGNPDTCNHTDESWDIVLSEVS